MCSSVRAGMKPYYTTKSTPALEHGHVYASIGTSGFCRVNKKGARPDEIANLAAVSYPIIVRLAERFDLMFLPTRAMNRHARSPRRKWMIHMTNAETNDKTATAAEQGAHVAPDRVPSKKRASKKKGAPKAKKGAKDAAPKKEVTARRARAHRIRQLMRVMASR
jgi:hypothetical protein